jgi:hypothetical protein
VWNFAAKTLASGLMTARARGDSEYGGRRIFLENASLRTLLDLCTGTLPGFLFVKI